MNIITLYGRVGADPKPNQTKSGKLVVNFSLATTEGWGENKTTGWHSIVAWEKKAEVLQKHVKKGDPLIVVGRVRYRKYEGRDGTPKQVTEIHLSDFFFVSNGSRPEQEDVGEQAPDDNLPF